MSAKDLRLVDIALMQGFGSLNETTIDVLLILTDLLTWRMVSVWWAFFSAIERILAFIRLNSIWVAFVIEVLMRVKFSLTETAMWIHCYFFSYGIEKYHIFLTRNQQKSVKTCLYWKWIIRSECRNRTRLLRCCRLRISISFCWLEIWTSNSFLDLPKLKMRRNRKVSNENMRAFWKSQVRWFPGIF